MQQNHSFFFPPVAPSFEFSPSDPSPSTDPFGWLEDRSDGRCIALLEQCKQKTEQLKTVLSDDIATFYQEICGRIALADSEVPVTIGDYRYFNRTLADSEHEILVRTQLDGTHEYVIFDPNKQAKTEQYFHIGDYAISPNHRYLAFTLDVVGDERYTLIILDIDQQYWLADRVAGVAATLCWDNDSHGVYHLRLDNLNRAFACHYHPLGHIANQDPCLYQEHDARFSLEVALSKSQAYVWITSSSVETSEVHYCDLQHDKHACRLFLGRRTGHRYYVEHHDTHFYILSNQQAREFSVFKSAITTPNAWQPFVAARPDVTIDDIAVFAHFLVLSLRKRGTTSLEAYHFSTAACQQFQFDEAVHTLELDNNPLITSDIMRCRYESLITPCSIIDIDLHTQSQTQLKRDEVLGPFDPADYESIQLQVTADDGVKIPLSLVKRKDAQQPGPCYLYGYGAYGIALDPWFSHARLSLLARGFCFAIAHVRGGGDCGEQWHDDGRLAQKTNSFSDFIACMKHLIAAGYTTAEQLVLSGGSAGGLLVGATVNQVPELCKLVIAHVPFVDVLNTMSNPHLPLTIGEYEEWGDPSDAESRRRIAQYCPYTNVHHADYPMFYITVGLNDTRVPYWEGLKWAAKLKYLNPSIEIITEVLAEGHTGESGRFANIREVAREYAVICRCLNIT